MTHADDKIASFDIVDCVIADSLRFRSKLAIGEDAYTSLKLRKAVAEIWDVGGVATTGAQVAALPVVASKFFASGGLLSAIGLGGTAATPIGWVVAAALVSGGAYYGVKRLFRSYSGSRVDVIPRFINTPIDALGVALFDLIGSLSLKIATMDGTITPEERTAIRDNFVHDWGYDLAYVEAALALIEANIDKARLADMADSFRVFAVANPDCNFDAMRRDLSLLLREVALADGRLDEREEMAIDRFDAMMAKSDWSRPQTRMALASMPGKTIRWFGGLRKRVTVNAPGNIRSDDPDDV